MSRRTMNARKMWRRRYEKPATFKFWRARTDHNSGLSQETLELLRQPLMEVVREVYDKCKVGGGDEP